MSRIIGRFLISFLTKLVSYRRTTGLGSQLAVREQIELGHVSRHATSETMSSLPLT